MTNASTVGLQFGLRILEVGQPTDATDPAALADPAAPAVPSGGAERMLGAIAELARTVDDHEFGNHDLAPTAAALLAESKDRTFVRRRRWVAVNDRGDVIGAGVLVLPQTDNRHQATVGVSVHPDHRRQGIGTQITKTLMDVAGDDDRTVLLAQTNHARIPSENATDGVLPARTGAGALFADDRTVRFARRCRFTLEQTALHSELTLPADDAALGRLRQRAEQRADGQYSLVSWVGRTPDEWIDDYAALLGAMSTDEPIGGLDLRREEWDAARVRNYESALIEAGTREYVMTAMHVPTHRLAGYTIIEVGESSRDTASARQHDTLVAGPHRGRMLGHLMKTANLIRVQLAHPGLKRLHTWNAAENTHMLAVNVAQGYTVASVGGQWQLRVAATS